VTNILVRFGILKQDLDYRFVRASMVIVFLFFGYSKWFEYEAQGLIPYISHGPLIFWLYHVFGIRGAGRFLGVSEWTFGSLLLLGFWNKKLGILGAIGSCFSFISTLTIIPFLPNAWAKSAGGFPAMTDSVAFLMKDLVLLAASVYLLRQDVMRQFNQLNQPRPSFNTAESINSTEAGVAEVDILGRRRTNRTETKDKVVSARRKWAVATDFLQFGGSKCK
jgi:uncharacterized membrane protein YkgB